MNPVERALDYFGGEERGAKSSLIAVSGGAAQNIGRWKSQGRFPIDAALNLDEYFYHQGVNQCREGLTLRELIGGQPLSTTQDNFQRRGA